MTTLQTPNRTVIVRPNITELDERIIPCNSANVKLGQFVNFIWDIGRTDMSRIKVREMLLEWNAAIDATDTASQYVIKTFWAFVESAQVLFNDVTVHETISTDTPQQKLYLSRLADREPNSDHYISTYGTDMYSHGDRFNPYAFGDKCDSVFVQGIDPVAAGGAGIPQANHVERFFDGLFGNLPLHRVN